MPTAAIFGPSATRLTLAERDFFRDADPWGFILFARNVADPDQLRRLTGDLRAAVGRDAPVMIDQEGGRVQRLRAPHWREWLPALDQMTRARDPVRAQWLRNRIIAHELRAVGIDANCAPLADLVEDATHPVLRNRLYGGDIAAVVQAARTCAEAHLAGGVLPILKHIPGYGRAAVDSHLHLPRVDAPREALFARDFAPFVALADLPAGMTAHILLSAIDPDAPATTSPSVMRLIRDGIGFGGLIMTDDISMEALAGSLAQRSRAAIAAGCDLVLHCNGDLAQMQDVAQASGAMTAAATRRGDTALACRCAPAPVDIDRLDAELGALVPLEA